MFFKVFNKFLNIQDERDQSDLRKLSHSTILHERSRVKNPENPDILGIGIGI